MAPKDRFSFKNPPKSKTKINYKHSDKKPCAYFYQNKQTNKTTISILI